MVTALRVVPDEPDPPRIDRHGRQRDEPPSDENHYYHRDCGITQPCYSPAKWAQLKAELRHFDEVIETSVAEVRERYRHWQPGQPPPPAITKD